MNATVRRQKVTAVKWRSIPQAISEGRVEVERTEDEYAGSLYETHYRVYLDGPPIGTVESDRVESWAKNASGTHRTHMIGKPLLWRSHDRSGKQVTRNEESRFLAITWLLEVHTGFAESGRSR